MKEIRYSPGSYITNTVVSLSYHEYSVKSVVEISAEGDRPE